MAKTVKQNKKPGEFLVSLLVISFLIFIFIKFVLF
jgi:hypothetical protein